MAMMNKIKSLAKKVKDKLKEPQDPENGGKKKNRVSIRAGTKETMMPEMPMVGLPHDDAEIIAESFATLVAQQRAARKRRGLG